MARHRRPGGAPEPARYHPGMIRDRLRRIRDRLLPKPEPQWAPEPTAGLGDVSLPGGGALERSAFLGARDLPRALARPGRITLQHHWATWAPAVEADVPVLLELHLAWAQYVDFFGVGWELLSGGTPEAEAGLAVDDFHRSFGLTWRTFIVRGDRNRVREVTGLRSELLPQTWIRGGDGQVAWLQEGALDDASLAEMEATISRLTGVADRPRG